MEMPVLEEREKTPEYVPVPIQSLLLGEEEEEADIKPRGEKRSREESSSLELATVSPESPEVKRKRRRQLLFIDKDLVISQEEMKVQIDDVKKETVPLADFLIKLPLTLDPKTLLGNPCMSLPSDILTLWNQAAAIKPIRPSKPRLVVPVAEEIPEKEEQREELRELEQERELSSKEIPREMTESGLFQQETTASSVVLETTDKDISPLETPEIRRSPVSEIQYTLEDIPEERVPEMTQVTLDVDESLRPLALTEDLVTFHSLLPPQASRRVVAQMFWELLEKTVDKQVIVQQDEPYGDIIISQEQSMIE